MILETGVHWHIFHPIQAQIIPIPHPAKISVGQWMATATLDKHISILASNKKNAKSKIFLHPICLAIKKVPTAIAILTVAWSEGNEIVGTCSKISWSPGNDSGLSFQINCWTARVISAETATEMKIEILPNWYSFLAFFIP